MLEAERPTQKKTARTYIAASSWDADGKRKNISAAIASIPYVASSETSDLLCGGKHDMRQARALRRRKHNIAQLDSGLSHLKHLLLASPSRSTVFRR